MFKIYYNDLEVLIHYSIDKESAWVYCHNKKEYDIEPSFKFKIKDKPSIDDILKEIDIRINESNDNINIVTINLLKRNIIYHDKSYVNENNLFEYQEYKINNKFMLVFDGIIVDKYIEIYDKGEFNRFMIRFKVIDNEDYETFVSENEETIVNRLKIYKNIEITYI